MAGVEGHCAGGIAGSARRVRLVLGRRQGAEPRPALQDVCRRRRPHGEGQLRGRGQEIRGRGPRASLFAGGAPRHRHGGLRLLQGRQAARGDRVGRALHHHAPRHQGGAARPPHHRLVLLRADEGAEPRPGLRRARRWPSTRRSRPATPTAPTPNRPTTASASPRIRSPRRRWRSAATIMDRDNYVAAINRFKTVVSDYQTTAHVEEALYRLTAAYLSLGIAAGGAERGCRSGVQLPQLDLVQGLLRAAEEAGPHAGAQRRLVDGQGHEGPGRAAAAAGRAARGRAPATGASGLAGPVDEARDASRAAAAVDAWRSVELICGLRFPARAYSRFPLTAPLSILGAVFLPRCFRYC